MAYFPPSFSLLAGCFSLLVMLKFVSLFHSMFVIELLFFGCLDQQITLDFVTIVRAEDPIEQDKMNV